MENDEIGEQMMENLGLGWEGGGIVVTKKWRGGEVGGERGGKKLFLHSFLGPLDSVRNLRHWKNHSKCCKCE